MIATVFLLVAVVLGVVELIRSRLESLLAWAIVLGFGALLVGRLG